MNFSEFRNKHKRMPLFLSKDVLTDYPGRQNTLNQLRRWQSRGLILKLKRGIYLLSENERDITPSLAFIANQLYWPSYVSLEYAMGLYGFIPERVYEVTSITTRKTASFENNLGAFTYHHLKPETFRGFRFEKWKDGFGFMIAEPEKAIVDFLYFKLPFFKKDYKEMLVESYRFQNLEKLKRKRLVMFAGLFGSRKLENIVKVCAELVKEGV